MDSVFELDGDQAGDAVRSDTRAKRGRRRAITDESLVSNRHNLVSALEPNWPEIAGALYSVRYAGTIRDEFSLRTLRKAFSYVAAPARPQAISILLAGESRVVHPNRMRAIRKRLEVLRRGIRSSEEVSRKLKLELDEISLLPHDQLRAADIARLNVYKAQIERELSRCKNEDKAIRVEMATISRELAEGETAFANRELLDFCRDRRYDLTPLNLATALAGLPHLAWRRSMLRCRGFKVDSSNSGTYIMLALLQKIIDTKKRGVPLEQHAKAWIAKRLERSKSAKLIGANYYYLARAIQESAKTGPAPPEKAANIVRIYINLMAKPSKVDSILAKVGAITAR